MSEGGGGGGGKAFPLRTPVCLFVSKKMQGRVPGDCSFQKVALQPMSQKINKDALSKNLVVNKNQKVIWLEH